uniref:Skin secretory protein xP2-like n=1 Tax=Nicotiana tabacum TaxID=4097 RepID=A0A1S3YBT5_TOBAC|nr:PREDICTED: skin secretory protein xP2-like [Nicotiana tabacum]
MVVDHFDQRPGFNGGPDGLNLIGSGAGEGSRPAITLPESPIPEQTTPTPTPVEGTTIPPIETSVPPPAPVSSSAFAKATENRKLKNRMEREGNSKARSTGNIGESLGGGRSAFTGGSSRPSQFVAQISASAPPAAVESFQARTGQQGTPSTGSVWREVLAEAEIPVAQVQEDALGDLLHGVSRRGTAQPASPAAAISSTPSPAQGTPAHSGRGAARGGAQSLGGPNQFYAMSERKLQRLPQMLL